MNRYIDIFSQTTALLLFTVFALLGLFFVSFEFSPIFREAMYLFLFSGMKTATLGYLFFSFSVVVLLALRQTSSSTFVSVQFPRQTITIEEDLVTAYLQQAFKEHNQNVASCRVYVKDHKELTVEVIPSSSVKERLEEKSSEIHEFVKSTLVSYLGIEPEVIVTMRV